MLAQNFPRINWFHLHRIVMANPTTTTPKILFIWNKSHEIFAFYTCKWTRTQPHTHTQRESEWKTAKSLWNVFFAVCLLSLRWMKLIKIKAKNFHYMQMALNSMENSRKKSITIREAYFWEVYLLFCRFFSFLLTITILNWCSNLLFSFSWMIKRNMKKENARYMLTSFSSLSPQCTRSHTVWIKNNNRRLFTAQKHMKCHCQRDGWSKSYTKSHKKNYITKYFNGVKYIVHEMMWVSVWMCACMRAPQWYTHTHSIWNGLCLNI